MLFNSETEYSNSDRYRYVRGNIRSMMTTPLLSFTRYRPDAYLVSCLPSAYTVFIVPSGYSLRLYSPVCVSRCPLVNSITFSPPRFVRISVPSLRRVSSVPSLRSSLEEPSGKVTWREPSVKWRSTCRFANSITCTPSGSVVCFVPDSVYVYVARGRA